MQNLAAKLKLEEIKIIFRKQIAAFSESDMQIAVKYDKKEIDVTNSTLQFDG